MRQSRSWRAAFCNYHERSCDIVVRVVGLLALVTLFLLVPSIVVAHRKTRRQEALDIFENYLQRWIFRASSFKLLLQSLMLI